ncbi:response regulator transcription factor [Tenacibaculum holothuriorum]|uniref:response regulator transcription factor n=1 Tax=Tenacibaculum holothuriorum TaxID=1635173 RepID=UPI000A323125|nr:helix-turn-helix transcriptional regulator [Tenacibaculum holothuriorum]
MINYYIEEVFNNLNMIEVYRGDFLSISYEKEDSLFIQYWVNSPTTIDEFKQEMLIYTSFYKKHKPRYTLWIQENMTIKLDLETQVWIEESVNIPCLEYGNKKCAFVVSKDVLAHIAVIDTFDKLNSCIVPKHFTTEEKAREWLFEEEQLYIDNEKKKITYEGVDDEGNVIVKIPVSNIKKTFKSLNSLLEEEKFQLINEYKFNLLTKREKEVLKNVALGQNHQEISDNLYISIHTVRTHIKNIRLKLEISDNKEFSKFLKVFSF